MVYQTIGDRPGDSDSAAKWDALRIKPETLNGAAVLDVGCNAGFFCEAAAKSGARVVAGIDRNRELISEARQRVHDNHTTVLNRIGYTVQSWTDTLPAGPWDVVLMLSAIHYERDQVGLLRRLGDVLAPGGVLVLECGVAPATGDTWQRCTRPGNSTVRFPSMVCLTRTIGEAGLVGRYVGRSVDQNGDAIPRHVFHCHKRRRELLLVSGRGRAGKSTLCAGLVGPVFSVDEFTRQNVTTEHAPWTEHAREVGTDRLQPLFESLAERPELLAGFVASLFDCVPDVPTLVVDCHELLTAAIQDAATARGFKVWTATTGGV
jgi:SAM-dependent methyltransferase